MWQAIEKVLLEDALAHPPQASQGSEEAQFTQLAPACPNAIHNISSNNAHLQLQIPDDQQQSYHEANTDACKVKYHLPADLGPGVLFLTKCALVLRLF